MCLFIAGTDKLSYLREANLNHKRNGLSEDYWIKLINTYSRFDQFCIDFNLGSSLPSTSQQLDLWASHLACSGSIKCPKTISGYLSAVRTINRLHSFPEEDLNPKDPQLRLTMNGIRRQLKWVKNPKHPHTIKMRQNILSNLDLSKFNDLVFAAIMDVGFFMLLRASNLVPKTLSSFNPNKQLTRGDVSFYPDKVSIKVRWAKKQPVLRKSQIC